MTGLERFSNILDNLRRLSAEPISTFVKRFDEVKTGFLTVHIQAEEIARVAAPEFNVFDLLGVSRDEVRTHSAMLAELLDPTGSHGQGDLFLKSFLELCARKDIYGLTSDLLRSPIGRQNWVVLKELSTSYGRMDVVLLNRTIGFICVIENKIDAWEQERQLERYFAWIDTMRKEFPSHALIYLTIRGYQAATSSNRPYIPISYYQDIPAWLDSVIEEIEAPIIRAVVQQYRDLAKRL